MSYNVASREPAYHLLGVTESELLITFHILGPSL
jgi:hypothetical protein